MQHSIFFLFILVCTSTIVPKLCPVMLQEHQADTDFFRHADIQAVASHTLDELPFVITICCYNDAQWIAKTLDSVFSQKYKNFRVICVDDASQDATVANVEQYIKKYQIDDRITFIKNCNRRRKMNNIYTIFHSCKDYEIIVQLDGDDWFSHDKVLSTLNTTFHDSNVWLSYGQFKKHPYGVKGLCAPIPDHIKTEGKFRRHPWVTSHPKAFYAWLIKLVKLQDLLAEEVNGWQGKFYPVANDLATVFPMLEMARERIYFNPEILYIYNASNPLLGVTIEHPLLRACTLETRKLPVYDRLNEPVLGRLQKYDKALADIVMFAKNNGPLRVKEALSKIRQYVTGLGTIFIFYTSYDEAVVNQFKDIEKQMPFTLCINVLHNINYEDYLINILQDHVIVTTDAFCPKKTIDIANFIKELEKTFAFGVYFSLSPHIFQKYNIPCQHVHNGFYVWKFKCDQRFLLPIYSEAFTLYRKKDVMPYIYAKIVECNGYASSKPVTLPDVRSIGVFFQNSLIE